MNSFVFHDSVLSIVIEHPIKLSYFVYQLVNQLKMLDAECKRTFQDTNFKEWKLVIQEIIKLDTYTRGMRKYLMRMIILYEGSPNLVTQKDYAIISGSLFEMEPTTINKSKTWNLNLQSCEDIIIVREGIMHNNQSHSHYNLSNVVIIYTVI